MTSSKFKGVILDLDGVITGTARVHGLAWESMFNDYLKMVAEREDKPFVPFDREKDYLEYVDGKPRMEGVKSFLESREIDLPFGDYDDPVDKETICGLGNRKNKDFQKSILQIKDVTGSVLYNEMFHSYSSEFIQCIDISDLPSGVYVVFLEVDNKFYSQRIIIK